MSWWPPPPWPGCSPRRRARCSGPGWTTRWSAPSADEGLSGPSEYAYYLGTDQLRHGRR